MYRLLLVVTAVLLVGAAGCNYSTRSGLPTHIQTVEVPVFHNKDTFYKGIEGKLTKRIIEKVNLDPAIRVVNGGGSAVISGKIVDVVKRINRETKEDRTASIQLSIVVEFSFYDEVEDRYILEKVRISSSQSSSSAGLYEVDRGELRATAEDAAIEELANEIVRRTLGMW